MPVEHVLLDVGAVVGLVLFTWPPWLPCRVRNGFASVGLLTCSALLVYFSGGCIEAHFHFFVIAAVLVVYEDWPPFVTDTLYVVTQHGVFGTDHPEAAYNHPGVIADLMGWGLVHAVFVLMFASALITNWFPIGHFREETRQKMQGLKGNEEIKAEVERLNE